MTEAKFILSRKIVKEQVETLENLGLKVSYSYKTNKEVGNVLQEICPSVDFSIHAKEEIEMIECKDKIWFFTQAESEEELKEILKKGIRNFVVDNEIDLKNILKVIGESVVTPRAYTQEGHNPRSREPSIEGENLQAGPEPSRSERKSSKKIFTRGINLSLRMKFQEHRIGTGKYFVYGMSAKKVNEIIERIKDEEFICKLGVHIHRKTQNTSEWTIREELEDSLRKKTLERIDFVNFGGGLPSIYRGYANVLEYVFKKLVSAKEFLDGYGVESWIEPGRFIAAPAVKLGIEIIQIQRKNIIVNTTIYNCALDTVLTGTKMLVESEISEEEISHSSAEASSNEGELESGNAEYLIKGNSPTRDDIFRYKVKLRNPQVGDKVIFLNAGAYNYTTDFFGYKKLKTIIVD